eukprot:jgi/Chrpa1/10397/Chrysochromulina_OHIO_Genome00004267-RA
MVHISSALTRQIKHRWMLSKKYGHLADGLVKVLPHANGKPRRCRIRREVNTSLIEKHFFQ